MSRLSHANKKDSIIIDAEPIALSFADSLANTGLKITIIDKLPINQCTLRLVNQDFLPVLITKAASCF